MQREHEAGVKSGGRHPGPGPGQADFWAQPLSSLLASLGATPDGLTAEEAAARFRREGPNLLRERRQRALLLEFLARFRSPLVLLLLGASAISAFTGDRASFVIIAGVIALSVTLDFVQEHRATTAASRLRRSVATRVTVLRDGQPAERPAEDLVPGDVVLLSAGALVPADGRVLEARDCYVNQALLTGESFPVEKSPAAGPGRETAIAEASNAVFMGTAVISGSARVLVCRTGPATVLGLIGESLSARPPATAFELGTRNFGVLILRLAAVMVLFVIAVKPAAAAARAGVVPLRGGARGGAHAGALADDRVGDPRAGRAPDGTREGHREAPQRDPRPRQHGRALYR